jgi:hypothetical protein
MPTDRRLVRLVIRGGKLALGIGQQRLGRLQTAAGNLQRRLLRAAQ